MRAEMQGMQFQMGEHCEEKRCNDTAVTELKTDVDRLREQIKSEMEEKNELIQCYNGMFFS